MFLSHPTAPCLRTPSSLGRMVRRAARVTALSGANADNKCSSGGRGGRGGGGSGGSACDHAKCRQQLGQNLDVAHAVLERNDRRAFRKAFKRLDVCIIRDSKASHPTSGKQSICLGDTLVARALDTDEDAVDPRCVVQKGFCVVRHLQLCRRLSYAPRRPLPICNLQFAGSNRPF